MRKLLAITGLAALVLLLGNMTMVSQQEFTAEQLTAWQAIAETFYEAGVDPNFMLANEVNPFDTVKPGMIMPDFTLMNVNGEPYSLSQFKGNSFVLLITGSWY